MGLARTKSLDGQVLSQLAFAPRNEATSLPSTSILRSCGTACTDEQNSSSVMPFACTSLSPARGFRPHESIHLRKQRIACQIADLDRSGIINHSGWNRVDQNHQDRGAESIPLASPRGSGTARKRRCAVPGQRASAQGGWKRNRHWRRCRRFIWTILSFRPGSTQFQLIDRLVDGKREN